MEIITLDSGLAGEYVIRTLNRITADDRQSQESNSRREHSDGYAFALSAKAGALALAEFLVMLSGAPSAQALVTIALSRIWAHVSTGRLAGGFDWQAVVGELRALGSE